MISGLNINQMSYASIKRTRSSSLEAGKLFKYTRVSDILKR